MWQHLLRIVAPTRTFAGWKQRRAEVALLIATWIGVGLVSISPFWQPVELTEYDWLTVLTAPRAAHSPIVIVKIDDSSFKELGLQWPWPRSVQARLVDALAKADAAVIAFDLVFAEPSNPEGDRHLATAIHAAGNVVLAAYETRQTTRYVSQRVRVSPVAEFMHAGAVDGLTNLGIQGDAVLRDVPMSSDSFWRKVLDVYRRKNNVTPHLPARGSLIRYVDPDSFEYVSYYQALHPESRLPGGIFKNRIVLIGFDVGASPAGERHQPDMFATPFLRLSGQLTPGVEINAQIVQSALKGGFVTKAPPWILLLFPVVAAVVFYRQRTKGWSPLREASMTLGFSVLLAVLSITLFSLGNRWLPTGTWIMGFWLLYAGQSSIAFVQERARERFIKGAFGKYVSSEIVEHILAHPDSLVLGGERREVSFVFTDIADFTTLTEQLDPGVLVHLVKGYFEEMAGTVLKYHGTIERFVGDGMVVLFNAPVDQEDHACSAVRCAMALDGCAEQYAAAQRALGIPFGSTRIGVNTGEVSVGNFGSSDRFHYTAMGDPINTAARLEGANKYFGTRVCVSADTASRCPGVAFRPLAEVLLKGKEHLVEVLEPIRSEQVSGPAAAAYREAYNLLKACDPRAADGFKAVLELDPNDTLATFHLGRLRRGEIGARVALSGK